MGATIISSIVAGTFGLAGGLLVAYKTEVIALLTRKHRDVSGIWLGQSTDIQIPGILEYEFPLEYELKCEVKQSGASIKGKAFVESDSLSIINFKGRALKDGYYIGEYKNDDDNTIDYGVFMFHFLGTGKNLTGNFSGLRMREHGIVVARVSLKKVG